MVSNLLDSAFRVARQSIKKIGGVSVGYARGSDVVNFVATPGETRTEDITEGNIIIRVVYRDYHIDKCCLDFGSGPVTPQSGDKITETIDGKLTTFVVIPDAAGSEFEYVDRGRTVYRVHTKEYGNGS